MLMRNYLFFSIYKTKMVPNFELRSCSLLWMRVDLTKLLKRFQCLIHQIPSTSLAHCEYSVNTWEMNLENSFHNFNTHTHFTETALISWNHFADYIVNFSIQDLLKLFFWSPIPQFILFPPLITSLCLVFGKRTECCNI